MQHIILSYVSVSFSVSLNVLLAYLLGRILNTSECDWFLVMFICEYVCITASRLLQNSSFVYGEAEFTWRSYLLTAVLPRFVLLALILPLPSMWLAVTEMMLSVFDSVLAKQIAILVFLPVLCILIDVRLFETKAVSRLKQTGKDLYEKGLEHFITERKSKEQEEREYLLHQE